VAFGTWQMIKYIIETQWRAALGWGVVLSKTTAGALYPTMFLEFSVSDYVFPHSLHVEVSPYFRKTIIGYLAFY
ncbi:hypothetical protein V500_02648, partial [Pseudogymnoascus sp. VKM F-4518 (FW-2643)]